ncbi:hypothetical protein M413DRAFT_437832 [Hebeloma cylindrosporum]|uniref:Uncharacterized protein n=1 Tax=Hebeloma cylindrosporum TaxID=76867 RepID=A0A0C3CXW4_HEBCY|nr:hypothetical protein M413DRAFT_437832 [Hebeloma cylindrosporum h7]
MTEYTTSSQAYREFMTSRERTAYWVHTHSPTEAEFYSPSVPPTVLDGLVPSSPPSEADSSHSTPPKMVLRYNDGRPDVPIPHGMNNPGPVRAHTLSSGNRTRSGSSGDSPSFRSHSRRHPSSRSPEEIRILPSFGVGEVPSSSNSSRPSHARSMSVPRTSDRRHEEIPEVPFIPPAHMQTQSPYFNGAAPSNPQGGSQGHGVNFAPPPHAWHPRHGGHPKHPPAIVYAPSPNSRQPQYSPPAMFHHPPQMGPNGLIYSHSAPVPGQYPPAYPTPYPSVGSHVHSSSAHDVRDHHRNRMRSLGRSTRMDPRVSAESLGSEKSGSTYYVLPAHGQKVHVIAPSPEQSVVTATSTTKTPSSPYGYGFGGKKPFFQRLFHFKKLSSNGSSHGGKRLHRRHSLEQH